MKRRVVVTGVGMVTPLANDAPGTWSALIEGKCGVGMITRFDASQLEVRIAAEVKGFEPEKHLPPKESRKMGLFMQYAAVAAKEALRDAGFGGRFGSTPGQETIDPGRVGVMIASGMGGLPEFEFASRNILFRNGHRTTHPAFLPMIIPNLASAHVGMMINARGPNLCVSTACASSGHSIGEGARLIRDGLTDIMVVGGSEAVLCETSVAGFASMRALSTRNEDPQRASRPCDRQRDGFVMGEGAGVLVIEELGSARRRGARILAEVLGYGSNSDAYHVCQPAPDGSGAEQCMRLALADAGLEASSVDYLNSHGTSTPMGDSIEALAIARVFGSGGLSVSSTKGMTGHLLGAAGGIEAGFSILAIVHGIVPPTINLDELDETIALTGLDFSPHRAVRRDVSHAMSNSFGFGGMNASLLFGRYVDQDQKP